jgi:hypothetical protein
MSCRNVVIVCLLARPAKAALLPVSADPAHHLAARIEELDDGGAIPASTFKVRRGRPSASARVMKSP